MCASIKSYNPSADSNDSDSYTAPNGHTPRLSSSQNYNMARMRQPFTHSHSATRSYTHALALAQAHTHTLTPAQPKNTYKIFYGESNSFKHGQMGGPFSPVCFMPFLLGKNTSSTEICSTEIWVSVSLLCLFNGLNPGVGLTIRFFSFWHFRKWRYWLENMKEKCDV